MFCNNCGNKITVNKKSKLKGYIERKNGDIFCSLKCSNSGKFSPTWKGGRYLNSDGHIMVNINGKVIREHRYIMEQYLGRKLLSSEIIHHINHISDDNRIENLQICQTNKEHRKLHRNLNLYGEYICPVCDKKFKRRKKDVKKEPCCSYECMYKNRRKRVIINCNTCGKPIEKEKNQAEKYKKHFCSRECKKLYGSSGYICPNCNIIFRRPDWIAKKMKIVFCSRSCSTIYRKNNK